MNESARTRQLCRELESLGALTLPYTGSKFQVPGWPDRWISHPLWTGWIELKIGDGELTALQNKRLRDIWARSPGACAAYWHHDETLWTPGNIEIELEKNVEGNRFYRNNSTAERLLWTLHAMMHRVRGTESPFVLPPAMLGNLRQSTAGDTTSIARSSAT